MAVRVTCAKCGQVLEGPELAGVKGRCHNCGTVVEFPPLGAPLAAQVESANPASAKTVDDERRRKNLFATAAGITVGCAVAGAIFWVGVCVLLAIFFARPVKDADEETAPSAAELLLGTQMPSEEGFEFKNITTRRDLSILKVVGEVTNKSGRNYSDARFAVTLYDKGGKLLDTAQFNVSNLADGATKGFEISLISVWGGEIGKYKIEFKGGM